MEEVRQLVQEEGREARNLVAFHVAVDIPARISRKPPRGVVPPPRRAAPRAAARLRSASAGRDKRSELRARYWALLFGDLQRAVGEIYNTVEAHENLNECQEVILVLENYTRDFKALGEWFRLKWEYDNTPPPQRPQSLAWEIRKTDFVRPESRRAYSVKSSPSVSGKNSPCLSGHNTPSGKNSPNLTGKASPGSGKISPRISGHSNTSPKANIEFFSSKITSKITAKPEPKSLAAKEISKLSDIKEKDVKDFDVINELPPPNVVENKSNKQATVEIGKAKECHNNSPKLVVLKSPKRTVLKDDSNKTNDSICSQAKATIAKLDAMETEFLVKHLTENAAKYENQFNIDKEIESSQKPALETSCQSNNTSVLNDDSSPEVSEAKLDKVTNMNDETDSTSTESPVITENLEDASNESSCRSFDEEPVLNDEIKINVTDVVMKDSSSEVGREDIMEVKNINEEEENKLNIPTKQPSQGKEIILDLKPAAEVKVSKEPKKESETQKKEPEISDGKDIKKDHDLKKIDQKNTADKPNARPAYSQAAAKPKSIATTKTEVKTPTRIITRSKTVVEMRANSVPKPPRQFTKRNITNKCSYPFNLASGRTSLFDGPSSKTVSKKPINRQAIGEVKTNSKVDLKKRPPRPTTLKINEKGDKKETSKVSLQKIKDCEEYSSSDTIVTQIDMSRIESSESLKTLVPEDLDVANSIEVLNVDNVKSDNDGWLTVKSRRLSRESKKQFKSHWANRFQQPSGATSLPTLNIIESPKQEIKEIVEDTKLDRAKSEQPQNKSEKPKVSKFKEAKKDLAMIRQKSDVTGLKTRTSKSKAFKREKVKDARKNNGELTKNRLHSSLESLTTGLARSQESTEEAFDFDKWKEEFKSTFNFLDEDDQIPNHNEILKSADPSEMSEIAEMTSQIEENERKISWALDFQSEVDQRKLCEEEDLLNRQIMELQQVSDIDLDTETDDTETDAEILCDETRAGPSCQSTENLASLTASLEDQYETALAGMSWAERIDTLGALEALVARDPGRAQQLHAKLSQGIKRRGSLQDALRRLQAKQARAERQRLEYQTGRARKIHQLLARVEEVKVAKDQLIDEKRIRMERRLQKAAENRDQHLKDIVRKAHDEEEKLREIAFIKQLEAENRRHEFLDQCRSHTTRLRLMRRDRLSKLEQKAAREAAVGARRQAIEAARKLHVETLLEKRKERDARLEELKEQKKQERDDAAREKAEGVKSRLSALAAAAELEADALRSRIRDKQDASQQRLESHLQAIREKATGPRQSTTSESQDQSSKEERELEEEAARLEQERKDREKQKAIKKKARKVKQKLLSSTTETRVMDDLSIHPEITLPGSNKMLKVIHQLKNILAPLQDTEKINENGTTDDTERIKKRNKKKLTNGDTSDQKNNNNEILEQQDVDTKMESCKKKKKKVNDKSERPKLTKNSSVCSSLSDMSKGSGHSEKRSRLVIDMPFLERQLNELHRMMEKFDRYDKSSFAKVLGVKVMGQFLAVAAERDDLATQFTCKSLTTAVIIISRVLATCTVSGAYFISTNVCVHVVKLLSNQLEKDLQSDAREMELTKQLSDCIAIGLDSVLCRTRVDEQSKDVAAKELELLTSLRSRAHTLISYLCLCGCITRAEGAGEARENIQTILTVCADLCHPSATDVGSERASATQSLRCALGTGVCGSRAEFCMLFAQGAELQHSGGFVRAARTTHLLRALAELDHQIVQESFGEGGWPLEFRAAVARLLSQHAPNDKEAPRTKALRLSNQRLDQSLSETMVLDLIVLVGFVVVNNPQLQETICDGWSVIKTLCTLPANWLVSKPHSHALLPTLVALSDRPSAAAAISAELSVGMLEEYMNSPEAQKIKLVQVIKQGRAKKPGKK